jgi:anti-sigma factor ChrR (cupin superfamily)
MDWNRPIVITELLDPATDFCALDWQPLHPGVEIVDLYPPVEKGGRAALLRYHPGASVPWHMHGGFEHILVLRGSQQDGNGVYRAGTLVVNLPGTTHRVTSTEGCIALAIWQRPVQLLVEGDGK